MSKTRRDGELVLIAATTGYSVDHVRRVSSGKRHNAGIMWTINRLVELQEALRQQLQQEYEEKFGDAGKDEDV